MATIVIDDGMCPVGSGDVAASYGIWWYGGGPVFLGECCHSPLALHFEERGQMKGKR